MSLTFPGKLHKNQIMKGYLILKEVENILDKNPSNAHGKLVDCSNRFYTLIPHDYGFKVPPIIGNKKILQAKMEMLDVIKILLFFLMKRLFLKWSLLLKLLVLEKTLMRIQSILNTKPSK